MMRNLENKYVDKEEIIIEILWKIIEGKYGSHQLLKKDFLGKESEFHEIVISIFKDASRHFCEVIKVTILIGPEVCNKPRYKDTAE